MTDNEKLKAVFRDIGVGFSEAANESSGYAVRCESGMPGYSGSVAVFTFNAQGQFLELGLWEE